MFKKRQPSGGDPQLRRLLLHATQLIQSKRHDLAEGVLRQILAMDPNHPAANRMMTSCLYRLRRLDEALIQARVSVSVDPSSHLSLSLLGAMLSETGQNDQAITVYTQALEINPNAGPAILGLASAYSVKADWDTALVWVDKGLESKPNHTPLLRIRAESLAAKGRADEAIATMEEFLRLEPDDKKSHSTASAILKRLGRFNEAKEYAQRALAMNPADPLLHNSLAQLQLKAREFDNAHRHFSEAGEIYQSRQEGRKGSPDIQIKALMGQAPIHMRRREFRAAEQKYRDVLAIKPDHALALPILAGVIAIQNRFEEALAMAHDAVQRNVNLLTPNLILGAIFARMEQHDRAIEYANAVLKLKANSAAAHRFFASIYLDLEQFEKAHESVQQALPIDSGPETMRVLAVTLAGLGRRQKSIDAIESVLREESQYFSSHAAAAHAFYLLKEFDRAEIHHRKAVELDPETQDCLGWLGLTLIQLDRSAQAKPLLEKSLSMNPYQRRVQEALQSMQGQSPIKDFQ